MTEEGMEAKESKESSKEENQPVSWYGYMGFALFMFAVAGGLWWYITDFESKGGSRRVHWIIAILYNIGGKTLTVGVFAGIGVIMVLLGLWAIFRKKKD